MGGLANVLLAVFTFFFVADAFAKLDVVVDFGQAFVLQIVVAYFVAQFGFVGVCGYAVSFFIVVFDAVAAFVRFFLSVVFLCSVGAEGEDEKKGQNESHGGS